MSEETEEKESGKSTDQEVTEKDKRKKNIEENCRVPAVSGYIKRDLVFYAAMLIVLFQLFMINISDGNMGNSVHIDRCCLIIMVITAGIVCIAARKKAGTETGLSEKEEIYISGIMFFILAAGFLIRIAYALYTPYYVRIHDLGDFSDTNQGHANYIYGMYAHKKLPDSYNGEFYHPPLYYFLCAVVYAAAHALMPREDPGRLFEAVKIVNCFFSCASLVVIYRIFGELEMSRRAKTAAVALCSFMPITFIFSGIVNNDPPAFFFYLLSLLFLIRWSKKEDLTDILSMGLFIGLGMMSKTSVAMFAFVGGPVMIYHFVKAVKKKIWKDMLIQFICFAVIAFPLGMWFSIRQYVRFRQPFGYVLDLGNDTGLYCGDVSPVTRFLAFPLKKMIKYPFALPYSDKNVNIYSIESSLFGEWQFTDRLTQARLLAAAAVVLVILSAAGCIFVLLKGKKHMPAARYIMAVMWLCTAVSYYYFNILYPQGCSMDYRYIPQIFAAEAYYLAMGVELMGDMCREKGKGAAAAYKATGAFTYALVLLFCILSAAVYLKPKL